MESLWPTAHTKTFSMYWPSNNLWRNPGAPWQRTSWRSFMTNMWSSPTQMTLQLGYDDTLSPDHYVYKIIQRASSKVSPSFIDTACTMGNRVSCLQLQAMINSYINNINNINPCWHHLPRCCVTQTLLSCSSRRMKVIGKLSATGANIKSWFKRAGHLKESGGSSLQCLLPTTMTWDSGQSFLFSVNVKPNFIKHNWGMMGISWVISPRTSCPQGTCKPSPAKRCWHRRACFNWSWKRWIQTSLIGHHLWRKPLVYF